MSYFHSRKGIAPIVALLILAVLAAAGGGTYVVVKKQKEAKEKKVMEQVEKVRKEGLVINLTAQNDSTQIGTAMLIDQNNNKTKVVIEINNWKPGVGQPAHVHSGACPAPSAVKYPLNNVVNGRSESMIDKPLADLLKELPLAVNVHKSADEVKVYVSCGDISGDPSVLEKLKTKPAGEKAEEAQENDNKPETGEKNEKEGGVVTPPVAGSVKEFTVTANNFAYDVKTIKVKKGDKVEITFKNAEGFHDLKIDEFNTSTAQLQAGGSQVIEFVADKTGTFEYYCSVGSHRAMGMKGNLVVE